MRNTLYDERVIMVSFRADEDDVSAAQAWSERLGIDRSELFRDALRRHLAQLAAEAEIEAYEAKPLTAEELTLAEVADWGPAEDWSDWADAAG